MIVIIEDVRSLRGSRPKGLSLGARRRRQALRLRRTAARLRGLTAQRGRAAGNPAVTAQNRVAYAIHLAWTRRYREPLGHDLATPAC